MNRAKLVVLNGFAAAGKTTIAKKYIAEHSMAMAVEADNLVDDIGDWTNHREEARQLTFKLTKAMVQVYLQSGHDVILPYLVNDIEEVEEFESIARTCNADYYEVVLCNDRNAAIAKLLKRGKWGGATSPTLTDNDLPEIEEAMNKMESVLKQRPNTIKIQIQGHDPDTTYRQVLQHIES